jgi:hypothetical protein
VVQTYFAVQWVKRKKKKWMRNVLFLWKAQRQKARQKDRRRIYLI